MHNILNLLLVSSIVVCSIMLLVWLAATYIKNYSIVDVFWAFNFTVISFIIFLLATGNGLRASWVSVLLLMWSLRLGIHLASRVFNHLKEEEGRYKQLRVDWQQHLHLKFFIFFQMQGISNAILCLPLFIIASNNNASVSIVENIGASWWFISILGEGIADWQLTKFKKNNNNKDKVCNVGLWKYSRHPNYFFQLMMWIGITIMAIPSPYGWLSIISPLCIGYLLFKVTGIPLTEEQSIKSKGSFYRQYQQTTSVFIPWFPKK